MKKTLLYLLLLTSILSCSKDQDEASNFILYYSDYEMLGASSSVGASGYAPSYKGSAPTEFSIERITLDGEAFVDNVVTPLFSINAETGVVSVVKSDTADMDCGKYSLTISCLSGGVLYYFDSAFSVTVYLSLPTAITTTNSEMVINLDSIAAGTFDVAAAENTSQVESDEDHIEIESYSLTTYVDDGGDELSVAGEKYFVISSTGLISVDETLMSTLEIDTYYISVNITTKDGSQSYVGAQSIDVVSAPYSLEYSTSQVNIAVDAGHTSLSPTYLGAAPTSFSILSVMLEGVDVTASMSGIISISDEGVIEVVSSHGFSVGDEYTLTIEGRNEYGADQTTYTITVINAIVAPSDLEYSSSTIVAYTGVAFATSAPSVNNGYGVVTYSFDSSLDENLEGVLKIDENTGVISAAQGHSIECGESRADKNYSVKVVATNSAGNTSATLTLNMRINPNYFTYFHYGNNLSLGTTEAEIVEYASQYRETKVANFNTDYEVKYTDMPESLTPSWSLTAQLAGVNIPTTISSDGTITIDANIVSSSYLACSLLVTATSDDLPEGYADTEANREAFRVSVKSPIFFFVPWAKNGVVVEYAPFVLKVNPKSDGVKNFTPVVTVKTSVDGDDLDPTTEGSFRLDFNGFPYYYNIDGPSSHSEGEGQYTSSSFLSSISSNGFITSGYSATSFNAASSYYGTTTALADKLCYIVGHDHATYSKYSVVVNSEKWKDDAGNYANGVFIGRVQPYYDPAGITGNNYFTPFFIWFDENF